MVPDEHSYRPDHDCIYHFNLRHAQNENLVFHESSSDATILYDNMPASALDKVVSFEGEVLLEKKSRTATMQEASPSEQIDVRTPGRPEIARTEDEKAET